MQHSLPYFACVGLLSNLNQLVAILKINLIINDPICDGLTSATWQDSIPLGKKIGKFLNFPPLIFLFIFLPSVKNYKRKLFIKRKVGDTVHPRKIFPHQVITDSAYHHYILLPLLLGARADCLTWHARA